MFLSLFCNRGCGRRLARGVPSEGTQEDSASRPPCRSGQRRGRKGGGCLPLWPPKTSSVILTSKLMSAGACELITTTTNSSSHVHTCSYRRGALLNALGLKLVAQTVKNLPAMQETWGFNPWVEKSPLEKGMATHSSVLAWRIPWTEAIVHGVTESD